MDSHVAVVSPRIVVAYMSRVSLVAATADRGSTVRLLLVQVVLSPASCGWGNSLQRVKDSSGGLCGLNQSLA